jgi:hypothetical protein
VTTVSLLVVPASAEEAPAVTAGAIKENAEAGGASAEKSVAQAQTEAAAEARASGRRVRVDELTDETTEVWAMPEGGFQATLSLGPVRTKRGEDWVPVDLTLVKDPATGAIRTVADPYDITVSGARPAGSGELLGIGKAADRLSMAWDGALPEPVLSGSKATYVDAKPGVDLVVEVTRGGVETFLVVKTAAAIAQVRDVSFPVTGPGAAASVSDKHGNVTLKDAGGRDVAIAPAPEMWDAAKTATGDPAHLKKVDTEVSATAQAAEAGVSGRTARTGVNFRLRPDEAWLKDKSRQFPLTIDPQINPLSAPYDIYVKETDTTHNGGNGDIQIGIGSGLKHRGLARLNTTALVGTSITSATFYFWNFWSGICGSRNWELWTTGTIPNGVLWDNQPTWNTLHATSSQTMGGDACSDGWVSIDGKAFLQAAANAGDTAADMGLRTNESDGTYFKQLRSSNYSDVSQIPYAVVDYNSYPSVTARSTTPATTCTTGAGRPTIDTVTPQLSATVTDVDTGASVTAEFEWWAVGGSAKIGSTVTAAGASGTARTVTVPAGAFAEGGSYQWRVRGSDGSLTSPWSSFCEFTVMVLPPPAPGCQFGVDGDFNGDGTRDMLVADPLATVNGDAKAGLVRIVNGADGATRAITQDDTEIIGDSEPDDRFGHSLAIYDANLDGCADVAIGAPFEDDGSLVDAGEVQLVFGAPEGLGRGPNTPAIRYAQGTGGAPGTQAGGDWFGYSLAGGKTSAGQPFLVVGVPGDDANAKDNSGSVYYYRGSVKVAFDQFNGAAGTPETDDRFGYAVAATPYHIGVSTPGEAQATGTEFSGFVCAYSHTLTSNLPTRGGCATQNTPNVDGDSEAGDLFGQSIAMAPYWPVGDSIMVVGVPGEDAVDGADAGMVHEFRVSGTSLTQLKATSQNTAGVSGDNEAGDQFGAKVIVVNTSPGTAPTASTVLVAVGAPGEDLGSTRDAGTIRVYAGGAGTITYDVVVERVAGSLPGTAGERELIGISMGASPTDLFVSSPYQNQAVWGLSWASLGADTVTVTKTLAPGTGLPATGSVALGTQVG